MLNTGKLQLHLIFKTDNLFKLIIVYAFHDASKSFKFIYAQSNWACWQLCIAAWGNSLKTHTSNPRNHATCLQQTAHSLLMFTTAAHLWCFIPKETKGTGGGGGGRVRGTEGVLRWLGPPVNRRSARSLLVRRQCVFYTFRVSASHGLSVWALVTIKDVREGCLCFTE